MAIKINFDVAHNPEPPTIVLAKRNGDKLGLVNAHAIEITDAMNDASELSFNVYKFIDGKEDPLWDKIVNFKLVHCVEWDAWFEIVVEVDESDNIVKTVFGTQLGNAELSQVNLYNIQINTEDDILREEYDKDNPTVLYRPDLPTSSLLHRLMEKVPHYSVRHVDSSIAKIQRTFEFDGDSIDDAFQEIAEEIHCLFVYDSGSDENGRPCRTISVYDLESNCLDCGHRGEFNDECPKCNGTNIKYYGNDTTIFVTSDEIAEDIQLEVDTDEVKNCFKLEAGDDLMTATIRNCNPNGSDYLWHISNATKADMSEELVARLNEYDRQYTYYQNDYVSLTDVGDILTSYNELVNKYKQYNDDLQNVVLPIKGYSPLMNAYYNTIDFDLYLKSGLMPTIELSDTSAKKEAAKLTSANLSPVSAESANTLKVMSQATANSVVLSMAKVVADSTRYKISVHSSSFEKGENEGDSHTWTGCFDVESYSRKRDEDEEDDEGIYSWTSDMVTVVINDDYESFVKQKIDKTLSKDDVDQMDIVGLFNKDQENFALELKKYGLNRLTSFHDAAQACIDILIEQGIADDEGKGSWSYGAVDEDGNPVSIYSDLYLSYRNKLSAITAEIKVRENEIAIISGIKDENGDVVVKGLQNYIEDSVSAIQDTLDFEEYLSRNEKGEYDPTLWLEFCAFRRDDKYSNDNYISDGLDNAEIFDKAREFIMVAENEIYKSAELQHSISAGLKNLLAIEKFAPLVDQFKVGNWLRVLVDDEVYKLRLIEYSIDYDSLDEISVEFSDSVKTKSSVSDIQDVLSQASSMSSSYSTVQRQAKQGEKSKEQISSWVNDGLDATNMKIVSGVDGQTQTWDRHGMLFREYDEVTGDYSPEQMKIINSTMAITTDNWETTKTAVGKYYYVDAETGESKVAYGVNAETIIGKLILGETIELKNNDGSLSFDENGLVVKNGDKIVTISPQDEEVINITNGDESVFVVDEDGELTINGNIMARSLSLSSGVTIDSGVITDLAIVAVSGNYNDLLNKPSLSAVAISGSYNDLNNKPNLATVATSGKYSDLSGTPSLSDVATSGNYNDLSNRPNLSDVATSGRYTDLTATSGDAGKLMYIDTNGNVTSIDIDKLKELLGI